MQTRLWIGIVALAGAALAGCGTIRRAKDLKAIQAELALAADPEGDPEAAEGGSSPAEDLAVDSAGFTAQSLASDVAGAMAQDPAPEDQDSAPDPNQPEALTKQCPVDFARYPASMLYCPQHGTRLRDLPPL
jgi:hypothetical protein